MSQTHLKLCFVIAQNISSPLTKPNNTADFGESSWEETFLSGPGYTLLDSHQLTETTAETQGVKISSNLSNLRGSRWPMADGISAQEAENIHVSNSYLISGGYDPLISNNLFANTFCHRGNTTGVCVPGASLINMRGASTAGRAQTPTCTSPSSL